MPAAILAQMAGNRIGCILDAAKVNRVDRHIIEDDAEVFKEFVIIHARQEFIERRQKRHSAITHGELAIGVLIGIKLILDGVELIAVGATAKALADR